MFMIEQLEMTLRPKSRGFHLDPDVRVDMETIFKLDDTYHQRALEYGDLAGYLFR